MRYMFLIYGEEPSTDAPPNPEDFQGVMDAYNNFTKEVADAGVLLAGDALNGIATATTVQVRDGKTLTTDGPFAETKETLGGFYMIECKDLDDAIAWAAKLPGSWHGKVEIRPVMEFD
ncbi:MAG: hypothetical protein QOG03_711 [Actinomycetota bacterium]|jgi:hypothetical protein|nr:hypothetical protein [Actinomycetota bacterium]